MLPDFPNVTPIGNVTRFTHQGDKLRETNMITSKGNWPDSPELCDSPIDSLRFNCHNREDFMKRMVLQGGDTFLEQMALQGDTCVPTPTTMLIN